MGSMIVNGGRQLACSTWQLGTGVSAVKPELVMPVASEYGIQHPVADFPRPTRPRPPRRRLPETA